MRRAFGMMVIVTLLAGFIAMPAYAEEACPRPAPSARMSVDDEAQRSSPPGELLILDALVLRPLGLFSMAVGFGGTLATAPWAVTSCSFDRVQRELLEKPAYYTFTRPLGDVEY